MSEDIKKDDLIDWQSTTTKVYAERVREGYKKRIGVDGYGDFFVEVNGNISRCGKDADLACFIYNNN